MTGLLGGQRSQLGAIVLAGTADTVATLGWRGVYADRVIRRTVRAADQAFLFLVTTSVIPTPGIGWAPNYPDRIWRTTLPTAATPTLFVEPFPRAPAALLNAWGLYPDQIARTRVHPAVVPYFVPGPILPIPGLFTGVLDDKMHLGTKESLGVTAQPTLGGWQGW